MLTDKDLVQLKKLGINPDKVKEQIENFKRGFPFLKIHKTASINNGIMKLQEMEMDKWISFYEKNSGTLKITKFVPASGAATRMFKELFEFINEYKDTPEMNKKYFDNPKNIVYKFFNNLDKFAFRNDLDNVFRGNMHITLDEALKQKMYVKIASAFLNDKGLNYGNLPKALLKFHKYENYSRTPIEEHLVEGANYASTNGKVFLHFTVSPEHEDAFETHVNQVKAFYEEKYKIKYYVSYSIQKPSTDTIAVELNNEPFRESDGSILFRPAGHGALIENLNDLDSDMVFIKNIDNIVPDWMKEPTYRYKKALAGVLLYYRQRIYDFMQKLEKPNVNDQFLLNEIVDFIQKELNTTLPPEFVTKANVEKFVVLRNKLNRPIRVCGMVKNEGEPGGGPFFAINKDGSISLQIAETAQINKNNPTDAEMLKNSTHFNPADLICCLKDYKGNRFNLLNYVDNQTGFISQKSKDGRELKAQELPGLWNGSMSDWNTIFVEIPLTTFNPVKSIIDLLRAEHQ